MFGIILIFAVTLAHIYVLWRARTVPLLQRSMTGMMFFLTGAALWVMFVLSRIYGHDGPGVLAMFLEYAGMIWMSIVFLLAVPMLTVEVFTGFGMLFPKAAPRMRGAALVIGTVLSVIALVQGTRQPMVQNYDVYLAGLPSRLDGTVIIGLSDMHLDPIRNERWLRERVSQVQAEQPDIIVLLGDIFEGHGVGPKEFVAGLQGLNAPLGVWAVLGNHEFHGRNNGIIPLFREAGIAVLRNERTAIRPGLMLAGVDDLTANRRSSGNVDLIARTPAVPAAGATILLSHTPWSADLAAKAGAGLMLCGHTHGGQLWPFGYLVRNIYPLFAGRYDVDGMTVIVSRGAGSWGPPMRLWEPGEIIRVTLRAKKKEV